MKETKNLKEMENKSKMNANIDFELEDKRSTFTKEFQLENGHKMMTISREPQHYFDTKEGKYKEFDEELIEANEGFSTKRGKHKMILPDGVKNTKKVKIGTEECGIEWELINSSKKKAVVHPVPKKKNNKNTAKKTNDSISDYTLKDNCLEYKDVFKGVDLEYILLNSGMKENIIIKEATDETNFTFEMRASGLVPSENKSNGTIEFHEKTDADKIGDLKYVFPAPFMKDAAGAVSKHVSYLLEKQKEDVYNLTILAEKEWINDADRVFPVVIDPYVEWAEYERFLITSDSYPISADMDGGSTLSVYVGNLVGKNIRSAVLKLKELSSTNDYILLGTYDDSTLRFDNMIDSYSHETYCCTDITNIIKRAIATGNYSVEIELWLFPLCQCDMSATFEIDYPGVTVYYSGAEYYENNQSFGGDALVGSVNLSNGKLLFNQEDCCTGSVAAPFSLSHYYNIDKKDVGTAFGKGWDLSINQKIEWLNGHIVIAKYTDAVGMVHYFADDHGTISDMGGLDMGLIRENNGYIIITKDGTRLTFNANGYLTQIRDTNENFVTITRNSSGNAIKVNDSFGREIKLTYSGGKLIRVEDPSGRTVSYTYNNSNMLTGVCYPDNTTVTYTYSNNKLETIKNRDNTITKYGYPQANGQSIKVNKIEKYPCGSNVETNDPEEFVNIDYRSGNSTAVSDRSGIRTVYVFDENGRAKLIYEDRPLVIDGEEMSDRFQVTGTTIYNYTGTKRTFGTSLRTCNDTNNMISNGSFEDSMDSWAFIGSNMVPCGSSVGDGVITTDSADRSKAFRFVGEARTHKCLKQTIPAYHISLDYGDTLILSAWAKAENALNGSGRPATNTQNSVFQIRANVCYSDGTQDGADNYCDFSSDYHDWQYAALPVRIDRNKELSQIDVYLDYSYNNGICLFDNVMLVNAPSQEVKYEDDLYGANGSVTVFGSSYSVNKRITAYDGIYTTVEERDSYDNPLRRTVTDHEGHSFVSVFEYDNKHRLVRTQNERNIITEYTYNSVGMQTSVKSYYWAVFNPDSCTGVANPTEYFKNETEYDSTGEFSVGVSDQRSENIKTQNSYNTIKGLLNSTVTPNGQVTNYTYDSDSDLITSVHTLIGNTDYSVLYGYTNNKLTSITHNGFAYNFTYDGMGRTKKVMLAGSDYTENTYILTDTTTVSTEYASGEKMTVVSDRKNQPIRRTYKDQNGEVTVIAEGEYDILGKPVSILDNLASKEYTYKYDGYDNVTEEKINGSLFKKCEYDSHNRLESTELHVLGNVHTYLPIYDKRTSDNAVYIDNAAVGITLSGIFTERTNKDNNGRVTEKKLTLGSAVSPLFKDSISYIETRIGFEKRLTAMISEYERQVGGSVKDTLKYTYDCNGNITEIRNGNDLVAKYTYDGLNQLTREDNAVFSKTYTFTYDAGGNILEKKTYAYSIGTLGTLIDTKTYTYATTGWKDRLTSFDGETITYDALGNPTVYRGHALTWKYIRQLASYDTLTFDYDASGIRTRKGDITYVLDGSKILAETRPSGTIKYFYGMNGVVGFEYNNVKYYYLKNVQGDITAIYDEAGNLKAEYEYDAWGNHVITLDVDGIGSLNPFRYRGYYFDEETGLYYLQSRYYDAEVGRFINADGQLNSGLLGKNLFANCLNNPVAYHDPEGNIAISSLILLMVTIGSALLIPSSQNIAPELLDVAKQKYNEDTVSVSTKNGTIEELKEVNIFVYGDSTYTNVSIDKSLEIQNGYEQEAILLQFMESNEYDVNTFGSMEFMKAQWDAHNLSYNLASSGPWGYKICSIIGGSSNPLESSSTLDIRSKNNMLKRQKIIYTILSLFE